ncbi:hypothetical protein Tco_0746671 [Tanacetum coccineum]
MFKRRLIAADQASVFMAMMSVYISSGLVLHQMTSDHNRSELGIQDHINEPSSSKLVPKVVPLAVKTATSRQELELLFTHHIALLRTTAQEKGKCFFMVRSLPQQHLNFTTISEVKRRLSFRNQSYDPTRTEDLPRIIQSLENSILRSMIEMNVYGKMPTDIDSISNTCSTSSVHKLLSRVLPISLCDNLPEHPSDTNVIHDLKDEKIAV